MAEPGKKEGRSNGFEDLANFVVNVAQFADKEARSIIFGSDVKSWGEGFEKLMGKESNKEVHAPLWMYQQLGLIVKDERGKTLGMSATRDKWDKAYHWAEAQEKNYTNLINKLESKGQSYYKGTDGKVHSLQEAKIRLKEYEAFRNSCRPWHESKEAVTVERSHGGGKYSRIFFSEAVRELFKEDLKEKDKKYSGSPKTTEGIGKNNPQPMGETKVPKLEQTITLLNKDNVGKDYMQQKASEGKQMDVSNIRVHEASVLLQRLNDASDKPDEIKQQDLDRVNGKYLVTAIVDGVTVSHALTEAQYTKMMSLDDSHRLKMLNNLMGVDSKATKLVDDVHIDHGQGVQPNSNYDINHAPGKGIDASVLQQAVISNYNFQMEEHSESQQQSIGMGR